MECEFMDGVIYGVWVHVTVAMTELLKIPVDWKLNFVSTFGGFEWKYDDLSI